MLINNEFVIERYSGPIPLTLLTPPLNMDNITQQQYSTFISNIVTIYGSQNENGSVPTFFKNSSGLPSSNSTLTQLETGQEYYFISKNTSVFPYAIPSIGGSPVASCERLEPCCPYVSFQQSSVILSGPPENLYAYLTAQVSGLTPGKEYNYSYEPVTANWPSKISPLSGTFIPISHTDTIDSVFSFSPISGQVDGYFNYTHDINASKEYSQKNIFSTLKIKLYPIDGSSCPIMSDSITVRCNKCLPIGNPYRPEITIVGGPKISLSSNCCSGPVPVNITITSAEPGKLYNFMLNTWPNTVTSIPTSGTASFGDGIGRISSMIMMSGQPSSVLKVTVSDTDTGEEFVDYATIVCNTTC